MSNKIKHFKTYWRSHSVLLCAFLISDQEHFMLFNCYQAKDLDWLAALQSYCIFTCHTKCWNSVFSFFDTDMLIFPHILPIQCMCVRYTHAVVLPSMFVKHNTIWPLKIWFYNIKFTIQRLTKYSSYYFRFRLVLSVCYIFICIKSSLSFCLKVREEQLTVYLIYCTLSCL